MELSEGSVVKVITENGRYNAKGKYTQICDVWREEDFVRYYLKVDDGIYPYTAEDIELVNDPVMVAVVLPTFNNEVVACRFSSNSDLVDIEKCKEDLQDDMTKYTQMIVEEWD